MAIFYAVYKETSGVYILKCVPRNVRSLIEPMENTDKNTHSEDTLSRFQTYIAYSQFLPLFCHLTWASTSLLHGFTKLLSFDSLFRSFHCFSNSSSVIGQSWCLWNVTKGLYIYMHIFHRSTCRWLDWLMTLAKWSAVSVERFRTMVFKSFSLFVVNAIIDYRLHHFVYF